MLSRVAVASLLLLFAAATRNAAAQAIQGRVIDKGSAVPVVGAFVTLLDPEGRATAAALTDGEGVFRLKAPSAGAYVLRIERMGNRTVTTGPIALAAGEAVTRAFRVAADPVRLEEVHASGATRCDLPRDLGAATQVVWDEVRKALSVAVWAERQPGVPYQASMFARTRDLLSLELHDQQTRLQSGYGRMAFRSLPAEDLSAHGYVRRLPDEVVQYYGVDAAALLSDAFLRSHCFRIERSERQPGVVGLVFEPIDRGGVPDIEGVLWVDQRTAELQHLEFTFTRHLHPIAVPREPFGGRVEFRRLANGAWVVARWWLRMPQLPTTVLRRLVENAARDDASDQDALRAAHRRGMRIWEEGAELRYMAEPAALQPRGATVSGVVYDSARGRPLADATVFVDPGGRAVRTDGAGRFRLTNLPAGRLGVGFLHPYADSLGLPVTLQDLVLDDGHSADVALAIPRALGCPSADAHAAAAAISGFVFGSAGGTPVRDAHVVASWRARTDWREGFEGEPQSAGTVTDAAGRFLLCGLPPGQHVRVSVTAPGGQRSVEVRTDSGGVTRQDVVIR